MLIGANLENAFNRKYFVNAHSNDNISPGYLRAARFRVSVEVLNRRQCHAILHALSGDQMGGDLSNER